MGGRAGEAREHLNARRDQPLVVVLPVYNEGENLRAWWGEARRWLPPDAQVQVVYDFDEDDTVPVARELAQSGAPLVLRRNQSRGVLAAMLTGMRAVEDGPVLVSMADLSDDLAIVPDMLAAWRDGADVVVASRYMPGGRQLGGPWLKGQLARWGGRSLHAVAGFPVRDATNNFRLYDASLLRRIDVESSGGFELAFELTVKAWMQGARIVELPCTWRDRVHGESRFAFRKWLPLYGRLWLKAVAYGLRVRS